MKYVVSIVLFTLLFALGAQAQDLPNNIFVAGAGFQPEVAATGNYQITGFEETCARTGDIPFFADIKIPNYLCQATDFFGDVTSARVESHGLLLNAKRFVGGWKIGGGVAKSETIGVAVTLGGMVGYRFTSRLSVIFSGGWQKDDVQVLLKGQTSTLPAQLKQLAARGVYRLGLGYSWGQ